MSNSENLRSEIEKLPKELGDILNSAVKEAASRGQRIYLVGGIVRDICWNNAKEYFGIPMKA